MTYYDSFSMHLDIEKGRSQKTINAYLGDIKRFRYWLDTQTQDNTLPPSWQETTERHIRAYLANQAKTKKASPRYIRRIISSLRTWYTYLINVENLSSNNPAQSISKPKLPKRHANALTPTDITKLIHTTKTNSQRPEKTRNWTAITLLYNTGLRISEFTNLKENNIRYQDGLPQSITVIGKGNKERRIPLNPEASSALHQWLKERRHLLANLPPNPHRDFIWLIPTGKKQGHPWGAQGIRKMLKTYAKQAGLTQNIYPHMLRHSCGNELVRNGVRIDVVKELFGHADISTTIIYTHADQKDLEQAVKEMPRVFS